MEEKRIELPDFDEWIKNYQPPVVKYLAAFDIDTGKVLAVGPDHGLPKDKYPNTISIPNETAENIISGEIRLDKCFVDPTMGELEITEVKDLHTIDDILHRIIDKKWTEIEKPDVYLTYDKSQKKLIIELSEEFGGSYKLDEKFKPIAKRKIFWDGNTKLNFLITDYNDPHVIHDIIEIQMSDLGEQPLELKDLDFPKKYSIYTRRLFKNYVMEDL